jgi:tRNA A-37 threonylcarbamoyl transferase component Bud32
MLRSVRDAVYCMCLYLFVLANYSYLVSLGHEDAIAAGVLHRDISVGNILIVGERGILIDWDLSKRIKKTEYSADMHHTDDHQTTDQVRQPTRTVRTSAIQRPY